ncbi:condensation domain-containing protein [Streptomyces sp. DSM 118878]
MGDLEERLARLSTEKRALLAAALDSRARANKARPANAPDLGEYPAELTHRQRDMWERSAQAPSPSHHWPLVGRLLGTLDTAALETALRQVVRRQTVLRTGYREENGELIAVVHPADAFPLAHLDLSAETEADPDAGLTAALARALDTADEPIDLTAGPPGRACLVRLRPDEHLLAVAVHPIATDYESTELFFEEWIEAYATAAAGGTDDRPPAPAFTAYARAQNTSLAQGRLAQGLRFWESRLQDIDLRAHLRTPADSGAADSDAAASADRSERLYWRLPSGLVKRIHDLSGESRLTPFMIIATGVGVALSAHTGLPDTVLSIPAPNRPTSEHKKMFGCLANPILLRVTPDAGKAIGDVLDEVRQESVAAYEHQDIPYAEVVARALGEPVGAVAPQARFAFAYHCGNETITANGLDLDRVDILLGGARADLSLSLRYDPVGIDVVAEYDTGKFTRDAARTVVTWVEYALDTLTSSPTASVHEIVAVMRSGRLPLITEEPVPALPRARPSWGVG